MDDRSFWIYTDDILLSFLRLAPEVSVLVVGGSDVIVVGVALCCVVIVVDPAMPVVEHDDDEDEVDKDGGEEEEDANDEVGVITAVVDAEDWAPGRGDSCWCWGWSDWVCECGC